RYLGYADPVPSAHPAPGWGMAASAKMGCGMRRSLLLNTASALLCLSALCFSTARPAFSATYYLTVAGLGGEPDYEQRFEMLATDTDKMLREQPGSDKIV